VAFALNQIFPVVKPSSHFGASEEVINFHDIFIRNAFTNWKDILREISYSPMMALNLSYLGSKSMAYVKETLNQTSFADENFAREVSVDDRVYISLLFSFYIDVILILNHCLSIRSCNSSVLVLYYSTRMAHIRGIRMVTRLMPILLWTS